MSGALKKRRNAEGRAQDPFAERKRRYRPLLALLGVEAEFKRLPRGFQEVLWRAKNPDPTIEFDPAVPPRAHATFTRALALAAIDVETLSGRKGSIPCRDFLGMVPSLRATLRSVDGLPDIMPAVQTFISKTLPDLDRLHDEQFNPVWMRTMQLLNSAAVFESRLDEQILGCTLDVRPAHNGKAQTFVRVLAERPERVNVKLEGDSRPASRLGSCFGPTGLQWASWPAEVVGLPDSGDAPLPVYAQSHALRQLHERLDVPNAGQWMEFFLVQSMSQPQIASRSRGDLLVEFRIGELKAGYLVARVAARRVVVRTFLFLTMRGTPEGDRLYERLRLKPVEAKWLGLHRLSSFTQTDLLHDPELRALLEECGCGHLSQLRGQQDFSPLVVGYAEEMRKYLRMAPAPVLEADGDENDERCEEETVRAAA
jgi:hypothetical protein